MWTEFQWGFYLKTNWSPEEMGAMLLQTDNNGQVHIDFRKWEISTYMKSSQIR